MLLSKERTWVWAAVLVATVGCEPLSPEQQAQLEVAVSEAYLAGPEATCQLKTFQDTDYFVCVAFRNWESARDRCRSVPGFDLVQIDSAAENTFVRQQSPFTSVWLGANDRDTEDTWRWSGSDDAFWQGEWVWFGGTPVGGRYTNWAGWEPVTDGGALDCGIMRPFLGGTWQTTHCLEWSAPYICEHMGLVDDDCDGMDDRAEARVGLDPLSGTDGSQDFDGDGVTNAEELALGGNPASSDTDGDSVPDAVDLLQARDLDGDGFKTPNDNCPSVTNPSQQDTDADGIGDACDPAPISADDVSYARLHVVRHLSRADYAVRGTAMRDPRSASRFHGYLPTGTSFLMFGDEGQGLVPVNELVDSASGLHAFALDAEVATWQQRGFSVRDVVGYVSVTPVNFGMPVSVRRFEKGSGANTRQALTASATEAQALLADGYAEVAALGYGILDEGRMRKPRAVVRLRRAADGVTVHSSSTPDELSLQAFASEGERFRLFPEPSGWTEPLYRLRNAAGREALARGGADLNAIKALGYAVEGVIGWVYSELPTLDTAHRTYKLVRLKKNGRYEHSADPEEITSLKQQGYVADGTLGRVVPATAHATNPAQCVGAPDPFERLAAVLGPTPEPGIAELSALTMYVTAYSLERVLQGQVQGEHETRLAVAVGVLDPFLRAQLLLRVQAVLNVPQATVSAAMGGLFPLAPTAGSGPFNFSAAPVAVQRFLAQAGMSGVVNQGVTTDDYSLMRVRAPQCQGLTYGAGDPASANTAARAVTVTETGPPDEECPTGEFCGGDTVGAITPMLFGVLDLEDSIVPAAGPAENWADQHDQVGYSIQGTDIGSCSSACVAALGQRCVGQRCRQYPVVRAGSIPVFTGANFWDGVSAELLFTEDGATEPETHAAHVDIDEVSANPEPNDPALRCSQTPAGLAPDLWTVEDEALFCANPPSNPLCPGETTLYEAEPRLERINPAGAIQLQAGRFYTVQVKNTNGTYYHFGEEVPLDPVARDANARTVHVCVAPACTNAPNPATAACELLPAMPGCGGTTGGTWSTPPRSLEKCINDFGPFGDGCAETPRYFYSEPTTPFGIPRMIYVADPAPELHVQTQLTGVRCIDETGVDAFGSDELMVWAGTTSTAPSFDDLEDHENAVGFYYGENYDSGEKRRTRRLMTSTRVRQGTSDEVFVSVVVGEDDDISFGHIMLGIIGAGLAVVAPLAAAASIAAVVGAGAAGGFAGFLTGFAIVGPDDEIGATRWKSTVAQVSAASQLARDGSFSPGADPVTGIDPLPLPSAGSSKHLVLRRAAKHPAVDAKAYARNADLQSCANDLGCSGSQRCYVGACVPQSWEDATFPKGTYDPASDLPGTTESVWFDGEGEYILLFTTSVSDESGF